MGIRNLQHWIRWTVPQTVQFPDWSAYKGKRVGVDILGFLYRAKACGVYPVVYVAQMIAACNRLAIQPVVVFDGKPPCEKQKILEQRTTIRNVSRIKKTQLEANREGGECSTFVNHELQKLELNSTYFTSEERDQIKQFLYACGVLSLNASGEADNVLAHFSRKGWISAVLSSDFDLLARGVENLLVPEGNSIPGEPRGWKQYTLSSMLSGADMAYNQFVEMCVLMGSDYTAGLRTIPFKTAYWTVKHAGSIEYTIARYNIHNLEPYARAKQILMGVTDTEDTLMNAKQWEKWHGVHPKVEIETLTTFANLYFPAAVTAAAAAVNMSDGRCTSNTELRNGLLPGNSLLNDLTQYTSAVCNYATASA